jgi:NTE family protein
MLSPCRFAFLGFCIVLALSGCATSHYPINPALKTIDSASGYRDRLVFAAEPDDDFFLTVTFSGGGTRAASLGFGVLETLRDTPTQWRGQSTSLLDQVDLMVGVSGGNH